MKSPALYVCLLVSISIHAENRPQFRGPDAQGRSSETDVPLKWSTTENIAWKTLLPGESWSSPIVWQDTIFVTTATDEGKSCRVTDFHSHRKAPVRGRAELPMSFAYEYAPKTRPPALCSDSA